jgi:rod shape-determining protein MreC
MPLGTLNHTPPPFFKQGATAVNKLIFFGSLSILMMFCDVRWQLTQPLRAVFSLALAPIQWLAQQPSALNESIQDFFENKSVAQQHEAIAKRALLEQALHASQVDQLLLENRQLRDLLSLKLRVNTQAQAAQAIYDAADPFTRRVILDKGSSSGVKLSSPIMDEQGVVGQVTRVYPLVSEATLIIDKEQSIPVLNNRTGARGVAFGESGGAPLLELRYMAANSDIQEGDVLSTSGVDGVYPAGVPVAKVIKIERSQDSMFARILCQPTGRAQGVRFVMVLDPVGFDLPKRPEPENTKPIGAAKAGLSSAVSNNPPAAIKTPAPTAPAPSATVQSNSETKR